MSDREDAPGVELGGRIDKLRRERGLTIEELAARADLDASLLRSLPGGVPDIEVSALGCLAEALGVELGELIAGMEWVPDGRGGGEYRVVGGD